MLCLSWGLKGKGGVLDDVTVTVALDRQWASHAPFRRPDWRTSFEKNRVAIESVTGETVEALSTPRSSFAGHTLETPWSDLQLDAQGHVYLCEYGNHRVQKFTLDGELVGWWGVNGGLGGRRRCARSRRAFWRTVLCKRPPSRSPTLCGFVRLHAALISAR